MTGHLGTSPKNAHVASILVMRPSSFCPYVGQTEQHLEYDSTMISARTNLRLPMVVGLFK